MIVTALIAVILSMFLIGMSAVAEMKAQQKIIESLRQANKHQRNMIDIQRKEINERESI